MSYSHLIALCVEDEPLVTLELSKVLSEMGFGTVLAAHRLTLAFDQVEDRHIDLALLDYDLGHGERTTELGLQLRARGTCVVFSSGYHQSDMDPRLSRYPFIEKPATHSILRARIAEFMTKHSK